MTKKQREELGFMIAKINAEATLIMQSNDLQAYLFKHLGKVRGFFNLLGSLLDRTDDLDTFSLFATFTVKQARNKLSYNPDNRVIFQNVLNEMNVLYNYLENHKGFVYSHLVRLIDATKSFRFNGGEQQKHDEFWYVERVKEMSISVKCLLDAELIPWINSSYKKPRSSLKDLLEQEDMVYVLDLLKQHCKTEIIGTRGRVLVNSDFCCSLQDRVLKIFSLLAI